MILEDIVAKKRIRLAAQKKATPLEAMRDRALLVTREPVSFEASLRQAGLSVIAEVKKASPSKGLICADFLPSRIAAQYEIGGAAAISVLTEEDFFLGSAEYLKSVKSFVRLPVLRKDFIIDAYQVYEARTIGADALLLIAGLLSEKELRDLRELAESLHMDALVEAHDEAEVKKAAASGAKIIGVNNRDLKTFRVDLKTTERLMAHIPAGAVKVSESGIETAQDASYLRGIGADAVLIGETLMKAPCVLQKLRELRGEAI
jgi:indole-3-glycerol phosphate synthase